MTTQLYYKIWHVLAELAKLFSILFFLNCGPSEHLVYSADLLSDLAQPDINCPSTKEPTILNIQAQSSDILFVGSRRENSGNYIQCNFVSNGESLLNGANCDKPFCLEMYWSGIAHLSTSNLDTFCRVEIAIPAPIKALLNDVKIRNNISFFQIELDVDFPKYYSKADPLTPLNTRVTTLSLSDNPLFQIRGSVSNKHFVIRANVQNLSPDMIFLIKSDVMLPLVEANQSIVNFTKPRFILGY